MLLRSTQLDVPFRVLAPTLVFACLSLCGCGGISGTALEMAIESTSEPDSARRKMLEAVKAERAQCPRRINSHYTLQSVKMTGLNEIHYEYLISERGREFVTLNHQRAVRNSILMRARSTEMASHIRDLGLDVTHSFINDEGTLQLRLYVYPGDFANDYVSEGEPEWDEPVSLLESWLPMFFGDDSNKQDRATAEVHRNPFLAPEDEASPPAPNQAEGVDR